MLLSQGSLTYRVLDVTSDSLRIIKRYAGMKGGKRKVKKGFAMATPESQKKLVERRWRKYYEANDTRSNTQQEEQQDKH